MTDNRIEKIKAEIERLYNQSLADENRQADRGLECAANVSFGKSKACKELLSFIDSLREEPVKIKKGCKYRCLSDMVNRDTGNISFIRDKIYLAPEDDTLVSEENGWLCDTSENASNFELVEEPVSEEWIEELRTKLDSMSKEDFKKVFDKYAVDFNEEPVIDDLGDYINELSKQFPEVSFAKLSRIAVRVAKWQKARNQETIETAIHHAYHNGRLEMKEQMMKDAVDNTCMVIGKVDDHINVRIGVFEKPHEIWHCKCDTSKFKIGDKVKVIVIKED